MQPDPHVPLRGEPGAPGTAIGPLWTLNLSLGAEAHQPGEGGRGQSAERTFSVEEAIHALRDTAESLEQMAQSSRERGEIASAEILSMQAVMALDPALIEAVRAAEGLAAGEARAYGAGGLGALIAAGESHAAALAAIPDEYLAARAADVRDVVGRAARRLTGGKLHLPETPVILIGEDLPPSISSEIPRELLLGVALKGGSRTAHAVILARAAGIPCIVATPNLAVDGSLNGTTALLDGDGGLLHLNPSDALVSEARRGLSADSERRAAWQRLRGKTPVSSSGAPIHLFANIGSASDAARAVAVGAAGVGLLRTEFALLDRQTPPSEGELFEGLVKVFGLFPAATPITIRLADIGGDKEIPYLKIPHEQNPFLGLRGYRLAMLGSRTDLRTLFRDQAAAALRAAAATGIQLKVMAPMITVRQEVDDLIQLVAEARLALQARGEGSAAGYPAEIGVMIEVPAAALTVGLLAPGLDFISIGTNDLTQYANAADRMNPALSGLQNALSPALRWLITKAAEDARGAGLDIGVCGELAGTTDGARWLTSCGITELSMEPAAIDEVRAHLLG